MLQSMTGFGKAICELQDKNVVIEIKTLNSKQLDLSVHLPQLFREKELLIRSKISEKLVRGKIDFSMYLENKSGLAIAKTINAELVKSYVAQIQAIASDMHLSSADILASALKMPDVINNDVEEISNEDWAKIEVAIDKAFDDIINYRYTEGAALEVDFRKRIALILEDLEQIKIQESQRIDKIRERILTALEEFVGSDKVDKNRFEQELIFYLEKLDITEEKVRLTQHCQYFIQNLDENSNNGRKLNFIAQEMGREINTIGSKANDADIQRYVVMMKDELEKIKEQSLNIL